MENRARNRSLAAAIAISLLAGSTTAIAAGGNDTDSRPSSDNATATDQSMVSAAAISVEDQKGIREYGGH